MKYLKLFIVLIPMSLFAAGFSGCYDDTDEDGEDDCETAPSSCEVIAPSDGTVKLSFTPDSDNSSIEWELRRGSIFDTGVYEDSGTTLSGSVSFTKSNGTYSARAIYTLEYKGHVYTIEAVDSETLSSSSKDYCNNVTCYEEGSIDLNLEFDIEGFKDYIDKKDAKCFIATAAFGSPDDSTVRYLRDFRDNVLMKNSAGRAFIDVYYTHSPSLASIIEEHPSLKTTARTAISALVVAMRHPWAYLFAQILLLIVSISMAKYLCAKTFHIRKT
jgi:hypothetical protein